MVFETKDFPVCHASSTPLLSPSPPNNIHRVRNAFGNVCYAVCVHALWVRKRKSRTNWEEKNQQLQYVHISKWSHATRIKHKQTYRQADERARARAPFTPSPSKGRTESVKLNPIAESNDEIVGIFMPYFIRWILCSSFRKALKSWCSIVHLCNQQRSKK